MASEEKPAEAAPAEGEGGKKKKMPGKKLVLFIVLPLLLIGGGAAGAYFMGLLDPLLGKTEAQDGHGKPAEGGHGAAGGHGEAAKGGGHEEEAAPVECEAEHVAFLDMPAQMIALNSGGRTPVYLKITVALELCKAEEQESVTKVLPRISDQFQTYLRELRPEDLKGSAGLYRLREELLARVNAATAPVKVSDVLFKEMIMQ